MKTGGRLSDKEYEALSIEYEQTPPKLSGKPGFLANMREKTCNEISDSEHLKKPTI